MPRRRSTDPTIAELIETAVRAGVAVERDRCAKIADRKAENYDDSYAEICRDIAMKIRLGQETDESR